MKIDIMTLFPEMINAVMRESIIGRAQDKGLVEVKATNIRDYALDKHHKADDAPYGGGRGQVMLAEPLYLCHEALSGGGVRREKQKAKSLDVKENITAKPLFEAPTVPALFDDAPATGSHLLDDLDDSSDSGSDNDSDNHSSNHSNSNV